MEGVQAINAVKKIQTPRGTMLMGALNVKITALNQTGICMADLFYRD